MLNFLSFWTLQKPATATRLLHTEGPEDIDIQSANTKASQLSSLTVSLSIYLFTFHVPNLDMFNS